MSLDRHHASERLFYEALTRAPQGRERFLFESCRGDFTLFQDVLDLIRCHEEAGLDDVGFAVE